jgi:glutathione synthase/RimK-type ligase-like ATP-grasp enzyme
MILVISSKKVYAAKRLAQEAGIRKQELGIMDMQDLLDCGFKVDFKKFDVLYVRDPYLKGSAEYLPQIIKLAKRYKAAGKKVVDSAIADGELGKGKWADYQLLTNAGLPIPKTDLLKNFQFPISNFQPLILKWTYGFKAKNVFLIKSEKEYNQVISDFAKASSDAHYKDNKSWAKEWLVQEFIQADYEYKVITVGYKALPVVLRFKIKDSGFRTDFKSACSVPIHRLSGSPINGHATSIISIAEQSSALLKRELAKVDILEAKGKFYILEVNRFPGLKSFEELTKFNVVKAFLGYLQK